MITKKSIYTFFNRENHLISNLAKTFGILSCIGTGVIGFTENLDRFWPLVALLAITASVLMAISLHQAKVEVAEINDAFNTLFARHYDLLSERVAVDAKNNPESFTVARIAAIAGVMRTMKKDPEEIDQFIRRLSERSK